MISLGGLSGAAPVATRILRSEVRAASNSPVDVVTLKKGSIVSPQERSKSAPGISPWRASTCQIPIFAWNAPMAFARTAPFRMPSIACAT